MKPLFFFDFETTGLPDWKNPSDAPQQPHIVQAGGLLMVPDTRQVIAQLDLIVRPDGWTIPEETVTVHGVTNERALEVGLPEALVMELMLELALRAECRVAYNESFDARIGRIASKRYLDEASIEAWANMPARCAMQMAKKALPGMGKFPKLIEAYEQILGMPMPDAHNAMGDTRACMEVFFAIEDRQASHADSDAIPA